MRIIRYVMLMFAAGSMGAWAQAVTSTVEITALESSGQLVFDRVPYAVGYRVEWAPAAGGPWTNSWDIQNNIPGAGSGPVTARVPMLYRVIATVTNPPTSLPGMALIPAGSFVMGHATNVFPASEGSIDESPQHTVNVSAFYMDRFEVTKALWDEVRTWATNQGYSVRVGSGKVTNHPVY